MSISGHSSWILHCSDKKKCHYIQIPDSQSGIQQNEILTANWNCKDYQTFLKSHRQYLEGGSGQRGRAEAGRMVNLYISHYIQISESKLSLSVNMAISLVNTRLFLFFLYSTVQTLKF